MLPKPPDGYQDRSAAESLLQRFISSGDYDMPVALPKRVDPAQAGQFVEDVFNADELTDRIISRCGELMRFYDLRGQAKPLPKYLKRDEQELEDFARSVTIVALLADLGDKPLQKEAVEYFQYLVKHKQASDAYPRLIDLFFHLPEDADPKWASDPIEKQMQDAKSKMDDDEDAEVRFYTLEDLLNDRLPTVLKARQVKYKILGLEAAPRRRLELVQLYLEMERNAYVDLHTWSMMMLQRECNEAGPPDLAERFQHGFGLIMSRGTSRQQMSPDDREDLKKYVTRGARGVEFYGGTLDEKQTEFADENQNEQQTDVLYWEPQENKGK